MKAMCGPQYTKKLEDMYQDLGLSEDASKVGGSVTTEGDQCSAMPWVNGCADGVLVMGVVMVVQRLMMVQRRARRPRLVTCFPSTCVVLTPWGPVPPGAAVCSALRGGTEGWHRPPARRQLQCVCTEDLLLARHEHVRESWRPCPCICKCNELRLGFSNTTRNPEGILSLCGGRRPLS
jgi:hypothetical protein